MYVYTTAGPREIQYLKLGDRMWPVRPGYATSKFFFNVIDVSQEKETRRSYENPELYFHVTHKVPQKRDYTCEEAEEYEAAVTRYTEDKRQFLEQHQDWYENRFNMAEDLPSYIDNIRQRHKQVPSYPKDGFPGYLGTEVWDVRG